MKRIAIIGGGASGFFAAINIAKKLSESGVPASIKILEATGSFLKKVKISGGGRCNVTHNEFDTLKFTSNYPRGHKELKSPFKTFSALDTLNWFRDRGIEIVAEKDGRMFPVSNSSQTIINCFMDECEKYNIETLSHHNVQSLIKGSDGKFEVEIRDKELMTADVVVLATGSSPTGYKLSKELGHTITDRAPSLFSFVIKHSLLEDLSGTSFKSAQSKLMVKNQKGKNTTYKEEGPLLITHWGLSGPAVLKISAWAALDMKSSDYKATLQINFSNRTLDSYREELAEFSSDNDKSLVKNMAPFDYTKRFWRSFLRSVSVSGEKKYNELSKKEMNKVCENLYQFTFEVDGKNRFKDEFVECGGVSTKEVDFKTMESKRVPGLYILGELLNIDGITGGFNFQNAWTGAWMAAQSISQKV